MNNIICHFNSCNRCSVKIFPSQRCPLKMRDSAIENIAFSTTLREKDKDLYPEDSEKTEDNKNQTIQNKDSKTGNTFTVFPIFYALLYIPLYS